MISANKNASEQPPRFSARRWAAMRMRLVRSTVTVGGCRSVRSLGRSGHMTLASQTFLAHAALLMVLACSCATSPVDVTPLPPPSWTEGRFRVGETTRCGFELVSVAEDLTATIRLDSGDRLSCKPGEHFDGPGAGGWRLQLFSACYQTREARIRWVSH